MSSKPEDKVHLIRGLGLLAALALILGNVIGTGVFLKARVMTCNLGSPFWGFSRLDCRRIAHGLQAH